jgi:hypothetical protein
LAGALACASIARAAEPNIEFSGVMTADGKTRLALTDKTTHSTQWVEPGSEFGGYEIARYDPKEDAVFVKKNGQEIRLGLIAPKTPLDSHSAVAATAAANSPSTEAAVNAIRGNLRTLAAAARQYQAERGVSTVSYSDLVGPGKFISELKPVAGENYGALTFSSNTPSVSVTMADGARVSVDLPPPATNAIATTPTPPVAPPASSPAAGAAAPATSDALKPTGR